MRFGARSVADAAGGRLVGPGGATADVELEIDGVSFDTRSLRPGQLFVPIVAERDGHDFIPLAIEAGASAYLTSQSGAFAPGAAAIVVDDTLAALMRLGAWARGVWGDADPNRRVVAVTGSVGKTSTKDLAAAALAAGARTWVNERSFNNDQGLPSTILNAPAETEVMVLEMGMRGFGEIARLAAIGRPHVGIITRVAEAHTELVGDVHGVARAKGELIEAIPASGVAVLNADDPLVRAMMERSAAPVLLYGESVDADVRVTDVVLDDRARASFSLDTPWGHCAVRLGVSGRHMAANAAAALSAVGALGHDIHAAAARLERATLTPMRMDVKRLASGVLLIDDTYNANPTSMRAALDALAAVPATRRVAVLGMMAEVAESTTEHERIAAYARERNIELVTVDTDRYGVEPVADAAAVVDSVAGGGAVLVKASRSAGLDRLAVVIVERHGGLVVEEPDVPT